MRQLEARAELDWSARLAQANEREAALEAHLDPQSIEPHRFVDERNTPSGQACQCGLLKRLAAAEKEKQELAESLNKELLETQLQLHQSAAKWHEQDDKLRSHRTRDNGLGMDLEALERQMAESRKGVESALDGVRPPAQYNSAELATVCALLECCREQILEQEGLVRSLVDDFEMNAASDGQKSRSSLDLLSTGRIERRLTASDPCIRFTQAQQGNWREQRGHSHPELRCEAAQVSEEPGGVLWHTVPSQSVSPRAVKPEPVRRSREPSAELTSLHQTQEQCQCTVM